MSSNLLPPIRVITSKCLQNFVVIESSSFICNLDVGYVSPGPDNQIVILIIADWDCVVDDVSD